MADINQAALNQLANIEKRTGKSLDELVELVKKSGLVKHSQVREMLKSQFGLGFGDASVLSQYALNRENLTRQLSGEISETEALDAIYTGKKAALRPIHEKLMAEVRKFGEFELAPRKTYLSLRRKRQFAMIGPATSTQIEVGLNMKDIASTSRLVAQPPGGMCHYKVRLSSQDEVDRELIQWLKIAYDASGG